MGGERETMRRVTRRRHRTCVLDSSLLAAMTYSDSATLDLVFRNGAVYRYSRCPLGSSRDYAPAPSPGAFFHRHIRNRFRYHRLT
jgi:hypothetical protein